MKTLQDMFRLGLLTLVLLFPLLQSQDVEAKRDFIPKYEAPCVDRSGMDYCTPVDCVSFCVGKNGFSCEAGVFEGSWLVRIACCGCESSEPPTAKTCDSNRDCREREVCSPVYNPDGIKTSAAGKEQAQPPKPPIFRCIPKNVTPDMKSCTSSAQCPGKDYICYEGKCVAK